MSTAKPTQTAPATAFSVCVYRAAIEKLNACRQKCPGIGGDVDVSNLHFLIYDNLRSASIEAQAANTLESFARGLEINATREVEALRMLDAATRLIAAAPETAAERDRLRESNAELLEALEKIHANAAESVEWIRRVASNAIANAEAIRTDTIPAPDTLDGLHLTPKGRRQLVIAAGMVNAELLDACRLMTEADISAADMERGLTTPQANRISRAVSAALAAIAKAKGGAS